MRILRSVAVVTLLLGVGSAVAGRPAPDPSAADIVERLTTHLDMDAAAAANVADAMLASRAEVEPLRDAMRTSAKALRAAIEAGDTAAMQAEMDQMQSIKADLEAIKVSTQQAVLGEMTVEQAAKWTLHHLHKKVQKEEAFRALRDR